MTIIGTNFTIDKFIIHEKSNLFKEIIEFIQWKFKENIYSKKEINMSGKCNCGSLNRGRQEPKVGTRIEKDFRHIRISGYSYGYPMTRIKSV